MHLQMVVDNTHEGLVALRAADRSVLLTAEPLLAEIKEKAVQDVIGTAIAEFRKEGCIDPELAVQLWGQLWAIQKFWDMLRVRARATEAR